MKFQVTVAQFPGNGSTRFETAQWVTRVYHEMKCDPLISDVILRHYVDTPIYMTRNEAVADALEARSDYLLMIDSDMCPDLHEAGARPFWRTSGSFLMRRRLRERGESLMPATIAAPYCGPPPFENIYVFKWINYETGDPDGRYALAQFSREEAAQFTGISEVAALPTGLVVFDCRQFAHVPVPWFDYEFTCKKKMKKASTEDVYYTRNASLLGFPVYCNWSSWAGHVKTKRVLKPHPIAVEDVAAAMRDALLSGRPRDRRVTFVGDPVEGPRPWAGASKWPPREEEGFGNLDEEGGRGAPVDEETQVWDAELERIRMRNATLRRSADQGGDPVATAADDGRGWHPQTSQPWGRPWQSSERVELAPPDSEYPP